MLILLTAPNQLTHLIRIYHHEHANDNVLYFSIVDIFPPASEVWERFRSLWKKDLRWLRLALDTSRPDQILVSSTQSRQQLVEDELDVTLRDIDPELSLLAASYKLIKAYPNRFCQRQPRKQNEYTWGIHHEDWMRAYAVTTFTCARHVLIANELERKRETTLFEFSEDPQKSMFYGYATDELLAQVMTASEGHDLTTAVKLAHGVNATELERNVTKMPNPWQLALEARITQVIKTTRLFQSKTAAERARIVHNTDGALSEIITETVCTTLHTLVPGIDLDEEINALKVSPKMQRSTITKSEGESLRKLLKSMFCRVEFDAPQQIYARLGGNLLPNEDSTGGIIDVSTVSINPYNLVVKAKVSQFIGMFFFSVIKQHILARRYVIGISVIIADHANFRRRCRPIGEFARRASENRDIALRMRY